MRVLVVTVSDRASEGVYEDRSGPAMAEVLREKLPGVQVERTVVPDDPARIEQALVAGLAFDAVITTGGTGVGPRDVTPDVTARFCDRLLPGIAEILRSESYKQTPTAMLSRAVAGMKGETVIVNVPGSVKGARFCAGLLAPVLDHALRMRAGEGHG